MHTAHRQETTRVTLYVANSSRLKSNILALSLDSNLSYPLSYPRAEMQEDLQKLPPGFPRGAVPQPSFPPLAPVMGPMHTLMPTQSLQPTQQLEYKVYTVSVDKIKAS